MRWIQFAVIALLACDKAAVVDAGAPAASPAPPPPSASASQATAPKGPPMPPRPLPAGSTTVGSGAPEDVQMKAIAYMMALQQPHDNDPIADQDFANQTANTLKPIVLSMDKGSGGEKSTFNRVEVLAGGRRIDLLLAVGCDAQMPQKAMQRAGVALPTLLTHGVLVVRCNDNHWQCLQNTRDPADVLCTTAPRHK